MEQNCNKKRQVFNDTATFCKNMKFSLFNVSMDWLPEVTNSTLIV